MAYSVDDVLNKYYGATKTAGANDNVGGQATSVDPVKLASEAGVREAESLMKVASFIGDVIGERAVAKIAESFGYDPEVMKVASLQDVLADTVMKIAEQVGGTTASGAIAATSAEDGQVAESAAHHANLAVHAATDAIQSLAQGDEHTATQMLDVARTSIAEAQQHAARTSHPAVHQHVAEAAQLVEQAANQAAAHASAAPVAGE